MLHIGVNVKEAPSNRSVQKIKLIKRHGIEARPGIVFEWVILASGPQMTTAYTVHDVVEHRAV